MTTFTKVLLSGCTDGMGILVTQSSTLGDTIHTAVSGSSDIDEIWLYVANPDTVDHVITIEFGSNANDITATISGQSGLLLIVPGLVLNNSAVVTAFADTGSVLYVYGFVNRVTV